MGGLSHIINSFFQTRALIDDGAYVLEIERGQGACVVVNPLVVQFCAALRREFTLPKISEIACISFCNATNSIMLYRCINEYCRFFE